jgi:hypothetical protein
MHGVINVITRPACLTDKPVVSVGYGNLEQTVTARLGARPSESLACRAYAKAFEQDSTEVAGGSSAHDGWHKAQAGFRLDGSLEDDTLTVQGDLYRGDQNLELPGGNTRVEGATVDGPRGGLHAGSHVATRGRAARAAARCVRVPRAQRELPASGRAGAGPLEVLMARPALAGWIVLGLLLYGWTDPVAAAYRDDAVKAAFLYRFTGYVEWPPASLQSGKFTVAVLGSRRVAHDLGLLFAKYPVKNLPGRVRVIDDPAQAVDTHVLYIGPGYQGDLQEVVHTVAERPVLVVTDHPGALDDGSAVNLLRVNRRVRFEVSLAAAHRAGLKVSSQLLAVAARVRGALVPPLSFRCPVTYPPTDSFDRSCRVRVARL